jgi:hypothetical protein
MRSSYHQYREALIRDQEDDGRYEDIPDYDDEDE